MTAIDTSTWGEFVVTDLFEHIESGREGSVGKLMDGDVPYIAASYATNGRARFVSDPDGSLTSDGNCVAMIVDGNGGIGRNTYQSVPFVGSINLRLGYHPRLNMYTGLFLVACLNKSIERYGYNFQWKRTGDAFAQETVFLPATIDGHPDWNYMQSVMERQIAEQEQRLKVLTEAMATKPRHLDTSTWGEFVVTELFEHIERGKGSGAGSFMNGDVPYIAASFANNGYVRGVADADDSLTSDGNCIAMIVNGNGGIGRNTYQAESFVGSSDLQLGYHPRLNMYTGLFLVACLNKSIERYGYNFQWKRTGDAFAQETVFLPVTIDGHPDWNYMQMTMEKKMAAAQAKNSVLTRLLADIAP